MNLKLTKNLNEKELARVRLLAKKLDILGKLQDGPYLRAALLQKTPVWKVGTSYTESIINQNIGPIFTSKEYKLERSQTNALVFSQNSQSLEKVEFEITLARSNRYPFTTRVLASLENKLLNTTDLTLDPLSGGNFGNIYALATYFYNKYGAYKKIQALLLEKKALILSQISEEYFEALLELFSAAPAPEKLENYLIPEAFIKEATCYDNIPALEKAAIFSVNYFHYQSLILCMSVDEKGNLVYDIFPVYSAAINTEDGAIYAFINENTNLWLKNLEQMAAFGLGIYEAAKTKILLDSC